MSGASLPSPSPGRRIQGVTLCDHKDRKDCLRFRARDVLTEERLGRMSSRFGFGVRV